MPDPASPTPVPQQPAARRAFVCRCGRPVFFPNSQCLACGTPLGYLPEPALLLPLEAAERPGQWRAVGPAAEADAALAGRRFLRCGNFGTASGCNWLLEAPADAAPPRPTLCRACRLNRIIPDQSLEENRRWWAAVERAKRRLVSSLIALRLPVASRLSEDPARGLAFDVLRAPPGGPPVTTGHADGIITLDVEEADDSRRERRRAALHEPYRTLLGHLRHEVGHYYWQRLVEGGPWHEPFRRLFGDERADYAAALRRHYQDGPRADWPLSQVSAYASAHPWEDWAETWAHYLHMLDTLDTAVSFGLDAAQVELGYVPFTAAVLAPADAAPEGPLADRTDEDFLAFVNAWMKLTAVLNELSRSMGQPDFYPFVLSGPAVRKLHFVHRVVSAVRAASRGAPQ